MKNIPRNDEISKLSEKTSHVFERCELWKKSRDGAIMSLPEESFRYKVPESSRTDEKDRPIIRGAREEEASECEHI